MTESELRDRMVALGLSLFSRGLTAGSSGNLSVRVEDGFLITPTNSSLGALDPQRITKIDPVGNFISGDQPSKELFLHLAIYEQRPSDHAIVHLHSTYSVAVSCLAGLDQSSCIPPLTAYFVMKIGRLPLVPYHRPGDGDLALKVRTLAVTHHAILLANHGPIVSGTSLESAGYSIEELEETAKIFLLVQNLELSLLTDSQIEELKRSFAL
jgi:ribulose-5-phosphate 4-epimerase/fuculose-1-phosphate aldolase